MKFPLQPTNCKKNTRSNTTLIRILCINTNPIQLQKSITFYGRMIAVALMHKIQIGFVFVRVFFLQLAGDEISLKDVQDVDPTLYSSCKQIIEMDLETMDQDIPSLTFAYMLKSWDP
ncbi:hypothetical protein MTR67_051288 [Solanum verrucosum]|uniref:HECT-type E3 ubiquitin transferase n=1 Tax=Solanum verrucosum TaxID=315347 RepID=A0AAF1A1Z6_SOLVR|nr:hypothetical protein MTR67_051288 [Solanum verrucosum]